MESRVSLTNALITAMSEEEAGSQQLTFLRFLSIINSDLLAILLSNLKNILGTELNKKHLDQVFALTFIYWLTLEHYFFESVI